MNGFVLPSGSRTALIGDAGRLSFDDVQSLVHVLQGRKASQFSTLPNRILGCLEDSLESLLALLACPDVTDYMPINPKLLDQDILDMAQRGGADAALLSASAMKSIWPALAHTGLEVIEWDGVFADAMGAKETATQKQTAVWGETCGRLILHTSGTTGPQNVCRSRWSR